MSVSECVCEREIDSFVCLWFSFCHCKISGIEQTPNVLRGENA